MAIELDTTGSDNSQKNNLAEGAAEPSAQQPQAAPQIPAPSGEEGKTAEETLTKQEGPQVPEMTTQQAEELLGIEGIKKDPSSGGYILYVDPSDPYSTVYKGATVKELVQNVIKGKAEADRYIRQLKAERAVTKPPTMPAEEKEPEVAPEVSFPNPEKIYQEVYQQLGLDPAYRNFKDEDWINHEVEHGGFLTQKRYVEVQRANQLAEARIAEANKAAINETTLLKETEAVVRLLEESGVDPEKFDFPAVLEEVENSKDAFDELGLRKPGIIVATAAKYISRMQQEAIKKQLEESMAASRLEKQSIPGVQKTGAAFYPAEKVPKTTKEALELALEDFKARYRKS